MNYILKYHYKIKDEIQIIKDSGENSSDIKSGRLEYLQHNLIYATRIKNLSKDEGYWIRLYKEVEIQVELQERNQYNYEQGKYKQSNVCQKEINGEIPPRGKTNHRRHQIMGYKNSTKNLIGKWRFLLRLKTRMIF